MEPEDFGTPREEKWFSKQIPDTMIDLVSGVQSTVEWSKQSGLAPAKIYGFSMEDLRYLRRIIDSAGLRLPLSSNIVE